MDAPRAAGAADPPPVAASSLPLGARLAGGWRRLNNPRLLPYFLLVGGLLLTFAIFHYERHKTRLEGQVMVVQNAALASAELRLALERVLQQLRAMQAFHMASRQFSDVAWQNFSHRLQLAHPASGVIAYGYVRQSGDTLQIVRSTPLRVGLPAFSSDAAAALRKAVDFARDRDAPALSGALALSALLNPTPFGAAANGLLLVLPVYEREPLAAASECAGFAAGKECVQPQLYWRRQALAGAVFALLDVGEFLEALHSVRTGALGLRVFDDESFNSADDSARQQLLYASAGGGRVVEQREFEFAGRSWQLQFIDGGQRDASRDNLSFLVAGFAISLLLALLAYAELARRERAERRTVDSERAREQAERDSEAKSQALVNMSHELRTPLHSVLSFADLGKVRAAAGDSGRLAHYFERIEQSGKRLLALVNDLLDLAKFEAGNLPVTLKVDDVLPVISETLAEFELLARARQIGFYIERATATTHAAIDAVRFAQVIRNLLSNALKFSPHGARIGIVLSDARLARGRRASDVGEIAALAIEIRDGGPGIPDGELESIFQKFVQSSRTASGAGGTGLGLAICREIMRQHRGSIGARNDPAGGAIFRLLLPRRLNPTSGENHT